MAYHGDPDLRIDGVTQDRYQEKKAEQEHIEGKDDDRYPVQPYSIIRQVVEEYRHNTGAHDDGEPSERIYIPSMMFNMLTI